MTSVLLSRFTPSLLAPEMLERLFVQRSKLAERVCLSIRDSALTENKHYTLITGPRGIGKTHFVSLVYHRLDRDPSLSQALRIAWLREEEWGVASYLDFLLVVLRALPDLSTDPGTAERYQQLQKTKDANRARADAEQLLLDAVGQRTLLIIAENLDEIFLGLGEDGQKALRGLIQTHPRFTLLGTAQSLFESITSRDEPFYGFFDVCPLLELTFESAAQLVTRVAAASGDSELARLLASPLGRARMRAVHHLAAGNPRVYVIFSQFIRAQNLDALVQPLLATLDDLTPYYQARMARLTPQQRKLVHYLAERRGAVPVHEIAEANYIAQNTTSSQLRKLDQLGYVRSKQHGRSSHYELREPLLRLTLEVKKHRAAPVRLIVHFLRLWYSQRELERRLSLSLSRGVEEQQYVNAALALPREEGQDVLIAACKQELERIVESRELTALKDVTEELVAVGGAEAIDEVAPHLDRIRDADERLKAHDDCVKALEQTDEPTRDVSIAKALFRKARALDALGRNEEVIAVYDDVVRRFGDSDQAGLRELVAGALVNKGVVLGSLGRNEGAIAVYDDVVRRFGDSDQAGLRELVAGALVNKGFLLFSLGRNEEAIAECDNGLRHVGESEMRWLAAGRTYRGTLLLLVGRQADGQAALDQGVAGLHANDEMTRELILDLLRYTKGEQEWKRVVPKWVSAFERHDRLGELGVLLVQAIPQMLKGSAAEAHAWCELWERLGESKEPLEIPLRILRTAVAYAVDGNSAALEALPAEERSVLTNVLPNVD